MNLYELTGLFLKIAKNNEINSWIKENIKNPKGNCFFYAATISLLFPEYKLIKGEHSKQSKEDTAHFYLKDKDNNIIDPTTSQYEKGELLGQGKIISAKKNIDFVINDPLFETLNKNDRKKLKEIATNNDISLL